MTNKPETTIHGKPISRAKALEGLHTPGKLHIGLNPGPMLYGPQGEQVADLRNDTLTQPENTANALRLVACWNACENMGDPEQCVRDLVKDCANLAKTVEELSSQGEVTKLRADLAKCEQAINLHIEMAANLRADKAELIDALKGCIPALEDAGLIAGLLVKARSFLSKLQTTKG